MANNEFHDNDNMDDNMDSNEEKSLLKKVTTKTKEVKNKVRDSVESKDNFHFYAAIGYIPFIGWMIPFFTKKESDLAQFHAKQSAVLSVLFIGLMAIVWILNNLPVLSHLLSWIGVKAFIVPAITYTGILVFLGLSAIAAYKGYKKEEWDIPLLGKIRTFLSDLFEPSQNKESTQSDSYKNEKNDKSDF